MIDDDISRVYNLTGQNARNVRDEELLQVLINTSVMAQDLGVHCFGYTQTDIRKYSGCNPFGLLGWVGCVIGVIGREYRFRDDKYKIDIDFCLQNLLKDRIIWMDNRYYFVQYRDNNTGGNSIWRTQQGFNESIESLKSKWKGCIKVSYNKSQVSIRLAFKRKGSINI